MRKVNRTREIWPIFYIKTKKQTKVKLRLYTKTLTRHSETAYTFASGLLVERAIPLTRLAHKTYMQHE